MMQYRNFGKMDFKVSALGFGAMRLPTKDGSFSGPDIKEEEAIRLLRRAIDSGVNYIDTAYVYHEGNSEAVLGKALKDGYRNKTRIATKLPVFKIREPKDFDRLLDEQLKRLQVDHIDFYLLHAMKLRMWKNTILPFDVLSKLERAQKAGKIGALGFSFHDSFESLPVLCSGFDKWDFCQLQINYICTDYQAGLKGLEYAASRGLGVIIMEPLYGGKLVNPPEAVRRELPAGKSPIQSALDFLWNRPEVSLLLSGMGTEAQLEENLRYAEESLVGKLSERELEQYARAKKVYDTMPLVPCTKCSYCMPCPYGVNIPGVFEAYNKTVSASREKAAEWYQTVQGKADLCRACKKCEKICPQHIQISEVMKKASAALEAAAF